MPNNTSFMDHAKDPVLCLLAPPLDVSASQLWLAEKLKELNVHLCLVESREYEKNVRRIGFKGGIELYNEHSTDGDLQRWSDLLKTQRVALLTDAGFPCVGDPGWRLVAKCHHQSTRVTTCGIHSPVLVALTVSGCPCQQFSFLGYPPKSQAERQAFLRHLGTTRPQETLALIETPYRFHYLLQDALTVFNEPSWISVTLDAGLHSEKTIAGPKKKWTQSLVNQIPEKPLATLVLYKGEPASTSS